MSGTHVKREPNVMQYLVRLRTGSLFLLRHLRTGASRMSSIVAIATRLWGRVFQHITDRNDRAVAAWGSALQYKRRYTNPEDAKRSRRMP